MTKGTERVVKEGERGVTGVAKLVIEAGEVETRAMEGKEEKESILIREEQKAVGERRKQKKSRYRLRAGTQYYKLKTIQKSISLKVFKFSGCCWPATSPICTQPGSRERKTG